MELSTGQGRRRFGINLALPVLMKEMRSRMRGLRAPILLFITTGLTILVGMLIIAPQWSDAGGYSIRHGSYDSMAMVGRSLFIGLIVLEAILCGLMAPALTAGSISIEKEQQTLDLLMLTRLSCRNIVLGKLFSSLGFLVLVLLTTLPVMAVAFLLGGVDPVQVCWALGIILATIALFGAIAIYCSARYPRTATAVAASYGLCILWLTVIPALGGLFFAVFDSSVPVNKQGNGYLVFIAATSATLALIPTGVLSILLGTVIRRSLPRWANVTLWLLIAGAGLYLLKVYPLQLHAFLSSSSPLPGFFWILLGNPAVALGTIIFSNEMHYIGAGAGHAFTRYFIPGTIGITLAGAWLIVVQAIRELKRLRDNPEFALRVGRVKAK